MCLPFHGIGLLWPFQYLFLENGQGHHPQTVLGATTCGFLAADRRAPRAAIRVITLAGLLTCASSLGRAFPDLTC